MGEIRVKTADGWQALPSHQKTSTGWKDIPTHTMTATGWQGELTSQSPLEFRATGQSLLDWRIDGRASENLFDINRLPSNTWTTDMRYYMNGGIATGKTVIPEAVTISVNNDTLSVTTDGGTGAGFLVKVKPSTEYRLAFTKSESLDSSKTSCTYAFVDTSETIGQLQTIYGDADGVVFTTDSNTKYVYFVFRKALGTISYSNIMLNEGNTTLPYEPYGGVGDFDETAQKYRIPVRVEGENLFDISDTYSAIPSTYNISNDTISMVLINDWGGNYIKFNKTYGAGTYTFRANITRDATMTISLWSNKSFKGASYNDYYKGYVKPYNGSLQTYTFSEDFKIGFTGAGSTGLSGNISDFQILEGTYTSETIPPYEPYINTTTTLYTDHQLMDGDSIDFSTDQTQIPIATGKNVLTVDTAVQPKSVFVKFEG